MAVIKTNTNNSGTRVVPINRNSLFYDKQSYDFELEMGKNYIEQDMGQTAVLYEIDLSTTQTDALYGETVSQSTKFKLPIEFPCVYQIDEGELQSYDKNKNLGTYVKPGKLTLGVYQESLDELGIDIKKGDVIGIQVTPTNMMFWQVQNEGRVNYDNAHTLWGTIPLYRTITCSPMDKNEVGL
jgi:hypothetical protein